MNPGDMWYWENMDDIEICLGGDVWLCFDSQEIYCDHSGFNAKFGVKIG